MVVFMVYREFRFLADVVYGACFDDVLPGAHSRCSFITDGESLTQGNRRHFEVEQSPIFVKPFTLRILAALRDKFSETWRY